VRGKSPFAIVVWVLVIAPTFLTPSPGPGSLAFEQVWTAPPETRHALHRVLALYVSREPAVRLAAEDKIVAALGPLEASPATAVLSANDYRSSEKARRKLEAAGFDGVISMRLLATDDDIALLAPVTYRLLETYWGWAGRQYGADLNVTSPEGFVRIETSSYALDDGELVWSGLSEPVEAAGAERFVDGVARAASAELAHAGVIPTAK